MKKQSRKSRENAIAAIIQNAVMGWQIPMMEIVAVSRAGEKAVENLAVVAPENPETVKLITDAVVAKLEQVAVRA